jgi:hypothetical protein
MVDLGVPCSDVKTVTDTVLCGPYTFPVAVPPCDDCRAKRVQLLHTVHPHNHKGLGTIHIGLFTCVDQLDHVVSFRYLEKHFKDELKNVVEVKNEKPIEAKQRITLDILAPADDFDLDALLAKKKAAKVQNSKNSKKSKKAVAIIPTPVQKPKVTIEMKEATQEERGLGEAVYLDFIPESQLLDVSLAEFSRVDDEKVSYLCSDLTNFERRCGDAEVETNTAEAYEVSEKKFFLKFQKRSAKCPEQCLRYGLGASSLLWFDTKKCNELQNLPTCSNCGKFKIFLLQVMPQVLNFMDTFGTQELSNLKENAEDPWSSLIVYVCPDMCWKEGDAVIQESVSKFQMD